MGYKITPVNRNPKRIIKREWDKNIKIIYNV